MSDHIAPIAPARIRKIVCWLVLNPRVDAMRFVASDFARLSTIVVTKAKQWLDTGARTLLDVTAPDNVLLSGRLSCGAVALVYIGAIRWIFMHGIAPKELRLRTVFVRPTWTIAVRGPAAA